MCSELWLTTTFPPQAAAVVPRMLALRVRSGLQLQLKRKEQINRRLRKGLISTRRQLHLKQIRVVTRLTSRPLRVFPSRNKPLGKSWFFFCQLRKYKLLSEKMKKEMEEQLENKNETIVDLHIQVLPPSGCSGSRALAKRMFRLVMSSNASPRCSG